MNNRNIGNGDPVQLQQMIIYLKSEVAKYKYEADLYKERIHYTFIENLEYENAQLEDENKALIEKLQTMEEDLLKVRQQINNGKVDEQQVVERFERLFAEGIEGAVETLKRQIEKLTDYERAESDEIITHLLTKITILEQYLRKEKSISNNISTSSAMGKGTIHAETLAKLDEQMNKILVQSIEYEKNLDSKLKMLNRMDEKLEKLEIDIENVKVFGVEGRVVKDSLSAQAPLQVYLETHMIEREES